MNMSKQKRMLPRSHTPLSLVFPFVCQNSIRISKSNRFIGTPLYCFFCSRFIAVSVSTKKYRISIQWHDLIYIVPFSLLYPVLFFAFQVWGLMYTSSSEAGIIQATIPILTMLLAAWF